jgi:dTDP-4-amino-4,6-dideoxygalactose transaminase
MTEMRVPLLDLKPQLNELHEEILSAVTRVVASTQYIMGPEIDALERELADYCGTSDAVGVSSGTDALLLSLMALDVGAGDLVLVPDFTFFATAGVVSRLNATPVFVDVDPVSYNLDPEQVRITLQRLGTDASRVKAMIPVHLYGQCADMKPLLEIAKEQGFAVIEDAAQAIGAEYELDGKARRAGSMGELGAFSFFPTKNLGGIGDGGIITVNDPELAKTLRIKRVHGGEPKYHHKVIGGNFRLDPLQAAVIRVKLPRLEAWHAQRRENAECYTRLINEASIGEFVRTPEAVLPEHLTNRHIYNQYVIRTQQRDELRAFLQSRNVASEIYYPIPFHQQECFAYLKPRSDDYPVSRTAAQQVLALPIYPGLTVEMQEYAVAQLREFYLGG